MLRYEYNIKFSPFVFNHLSLNSNITETHPLQYDRQLPTLQKSGTHLTTFSGQILYSETFLKLKFVKLEKL